MTRTPLARWHTLCVVVMVCNTWVRGEPICPNDTSDGPAVPGDIANDMCNCHQGWGGPGTCGVCQNDAVCQAKLGAPNAICSTDKYAAVKDIQAWCDVRASDITRFYIPRPSLGLGYNVNGSLWFEFFKRSMMAFRCDSDHTRMSVDKDGLIHYIASDLRCVATCEKMDDDLCRAMHGAAPMITPPADIICDPKDQSCTVYEEVLKDQLGASNGVGLINCMMAECILPGQTPVLPPFEPTPKPRPPAAETACVALAWIWLCAIAGMLGIAASYYFGGSKMQYCSSYARAMQAGLGPHDSKMEMLSPLGDSMTDDESAPPTTYTLVWDSLCYTVGSRKILKNVSGVARPGELLAVMGASGCGKTTLVDIIALKRKSGTTTGALMYNSERALGHGNAHMSCGGCYGGDVRGIGPINGGISGPHESPRYPTSDNDVSSSRSALKDVVGFVDQEDYLKGTLTVFEAVLFSASLRLPGSMHFTTKVKRSMQVLRDLRISKVADNFIGSQGHRGISGGERRRVSVALELVKVPAVLCLDEPTSGLDSYNARVLVDCLRDLARRRRTTVVMTIHQPRSSVFYSMDRLLVLHEGEMAYYGASHGLVSFLASVGYCMPVGHNPADYLMDLIFGDVATGGGSEGEAEGDGVGMGEKYSGCVEEGNGGGAEGGGVRRRKKKSSHSNDNDDDEEDGDEGEDDVAVGGARDEEEAPLSPPRGRSPLRPQASDRLRTLTQHFQRSEELKALREEMAMLLRPYEPPQVQRPSSINNTHTDTHTHTPRHPHATSPSSSAYRSPVCATPTHTDVSGAHTDLSASGLYGTPTPTHGDVSTSASTHIHAHGGHDGGRRSPSATDTLTHDPHTRSQIHAQPEGPHTQRRAPSPVEHTNAHTHSGVRRTASVESGVSAVFSANQTWGALKRWVSEASILSRRSTLELWRNPFLLMSHALAMLYFAMVLGVIYFKLESSGFEALQNRVGILLLSCLFLTFSGISALPLIWLERTLYIHEYSNRFYSRSAYFVTKVFFDLVPLRIAPTIIYAVITNAMIELTGWGHQFINYLGFLILLVCVSSVISTILGMMTRNIMSGIFIGTMAMIHFIMLSSLFINFKKMRLSWLRWLERVSFFNYALNGVVINELRNLNLTDFPVATGQGVLSYFNINATEANMYDCMLQLFLYLMVASIVAYGALVIFIRESR